MVSTVVGIIGGSGFYAMDGHTGTKILDVSTPFSDGPVLVYESEVGGKQVKFLPRHGSKHGIPPHQINYRANIWALRECGVEAIFAVNVVGGISDAMAPGTLVVPDQLIDYTWGRAHTFFDVLDTAENHIDFTWPYADSLRQVLLTCCASHGLSCQDGGVYGCTQGPRLETAAEIRKLKGDGCDIVGMTGMPEAALARELGIPYASIALVVNWGAGLTSGNIDFADINATLDAGLAGIRQVLKTAIASLP